MGRNFGLEIEEMSFEKMKEKYSLLDFQNIDDDVKSVNY